MSILGTIQAAGQVGQTVSEIEAAFRAEHGELSPSRDYIAELVGWHLSRDRIVAIGTKRGGETVYVARGPR